MDSLNLPERAGGYPALPAARCAVHHAWHPLVPRRRCLACFLGQAKADLSYRIAPNA